MGSSEAEEGISSLKEEAGERCSECHASESSSSELHGCSKIRDAVAQLESSKIKWAGLCVSPTYAGREPLPTSQGHKGGYLRVGRTSHESPYDALLISLIKEDPVEHSGTRQETLLCRYTNLVVVFSESGIHRIFIEDFHTRI